MKILQILARIVLSHQEKKTLSMLVNIPEHKDRTVTSLFRNTRKTLKHLTPRFVFHANPGKCFICGQTEQQLSSPLQAHHFGIERCFAEGDINWNIVKEDFPDFNWAIFNPLQPYQFVDNMATQGMMLCETHHIGKDTGIHNLTFSLWIMQRYLKSGYQYNDREILNSSLDR